MERCSKLDSFCYVCGKLEPKHGKQERKNLFSNNFKLAYKLYFREEDTSGDEHTPNTVCSLCYGNLLGWLHQRNVCLRYVKPMLWVRNTSGVHDPDKCYACVNFTKEITRKKRRAKVYNVTDSAELPIPMPDDAEVPKPPSPSMLSMMTSERGNTNYGDFDPDFFPEIADDASKPLAQEEIDFLVAKFRFSQRDAEFFTTFMKRRNLTQKNVIASGYRKRQAEFQKLYNVNDLNTFTYCNDIKALVNKMGMEYNAADWRLFIDGSTSSLKAVLLHVTNKMPSIPLAFGTNMKECYEVMADILDKIKYTQHNWKICCDLKVVNILQGVIEKGGFPKFFCFYCTWDSRYKHDHYKATHWVKRDLKNQKHLNLFNKPLIENIDNILLPPLHIKLGIVKKFIEVAVKGNDQIFDCLKGIFPKLSNDKITAGIVFHFLALMLIHFAIFALFFMYVTCCFFSFFIQVC